MIGKDGCTEILNRYTQKQMKKGVVQVQNQSTVKYHNSYLVWSIIRDNSMKKPISRADIAKETSMSPTSITRITSMLMDIGLVDQAETFSKGVGRKGTRLCIVKDAFYSLGISIDSDYIRLCILDCTGMILTNDSYKLEDRIYEPREILAIAKEIYDKVCDENKRFKNLVKVMGISCIGNVNHITGEIYFAPQMKWDKKINIKNMAERLFHLPASVENDLKAALIGATYSSETMKNSDVAYITIGTGVGISVMYGGKLIRGINNAAGEIGHTIFEPNGRKCVCGRRGCLATYLTEKGLVDISNKAGYNVSNMEEIMDPFNKGEEWAVKLIDDFTNNIAIMICNMIYTYNSRYLLVSGSIIVDYPIIFDMAVEKLKGMIHDNLYTDVIIQASDQKKEAAMGAAYIAQYSYIKELIEGYAGAISL